MRPPRWTRTHVSDRPDATRLAGLPAIYLSADYRYELGGEWHAFRIGGLTPALDAAYPDARWFGMLTASNPGFVPRPEEDNRAADRALQRTLDRMGLLYRPGFAAVRNRNQKAYNWVVIDPTPADFTGLGRAYGQIGTLLWQRGTPVRLRMRAERPAEVAEHPFIDWIGDAQDA